MAAALARCWKCYGQAARRQHVSVGEAREVVACFDCKAAGSDPGRGLRDDAQARNPRQPQCAVEVFRSTPDHFQKKRVYARRNKNAPTSPGRADAGFVRNAGLIRPGWCFSMKLLSIPRWCG